MKLLLVFMMISPVFNTYGQQASELLQFRENKVIPAVIENNVLKALSFYPELKNTTISFIFKTSIKTSVMQAQPVFTTLLDRRKNRRYRINISEHFELLKSQMPITEIPDDVMIGWIGHELGHILDYEGRSNMGLISFGYRYYFHPSFVKHAEMLADSFAVERGLGNYIVATKRFILDHAELPQAYKDKIRRLYLSPDIIVEQVRQLEEKKLLQKLQ
ncbi:hypothetical protein [Segetibacter sp.]|jgi:hypothetical protein|uniref:hypothetical protein n=1 Tax=Segetibacter sp. TaxID=2231182 RepID=UPI0026216178|nr:hypothetical protein [Segetibacter sp.]